jgi:hypothetical protein
MKDSLNHVQKPKSIASFLTEAELLIRALNDEMGPAVRGNREIVDPGRLVGLVKRFQELDFRLKSGKIRDSRKGAGPLASSASMYDEINGFLRQYDAFPTVVPRSLDDPRARGWTFEWAREGNQPFVELRLIQKIVDIAQAQRISSIRQCKQCDRWFYARASIQRFCPKGECREQFHRTSPEDKKRRREWARDYYHKQKTKNVK